MITSQPWDSGFLSRSPAFEVLHAAAHGLDLSAWPSMAALTQRARRLMPPDAKSITFVDSQAEVPLSYEERIHGKGEVFCRRENWHDFLNALVWMTFPEAKTALNARHVEELAKETPAQRGRARDALTLFDEGGAMVCSSDPLMLDLIRTFQWKELFWRQRERFQDTTGVFLFGHAMYHKLLDPFLGVSALALLHPMPGGFLKMSLQEQLGHADAETAKRLADAHALATPRDLAPLPILGVPGWFAGNDKASFYDNQDYFRPGRTRAVRRDQA